MRYRPLTPDDRSAMLAAIGVKSIDDLFVDVPQAARREGFVDLPRVAGELEVERALGDVVFVETPEAGKTVARGDSFAVVESVKAASDVYAPVSGEVIEGNAALASAPETVNADPEGEGWFARIKVSDASQVDALMDRAAYDAFLATL